jgi:thymidylate synthase ThyX
VLDCLRGLLPGSALTNMGMYGNGRFFECLVQKLNCHNLAEMQDIGKKSFQELSKVMPSFVRRADPNHKYQRTFAQFREQMSNDLKNLSERHTSSLHKMPSSGIRLINYDPESPYKVAAALLFEYCEAGLLELQECCHNLSEEELSRILDSASIFRENRRHKSPRALEHASFTFEIVADFGVFRDLHRHRMLTQDRQLLTCNFGYYIPPEILGTEMEDQYRKAMDEAKKVYGKIAEALPEEAQYVVPMAYNMHWYFHINLRSLQWMCELRSSSAGHPTYRFIAQEMAKQVSKIFPAFERFFKFVDLEGYEMGRLGQEVRIVEKKMAKKE